jgi:DNA-directed RNA polymerase specialized sigma subunit
MLDDPLMRPHLNEAAKAGATLHGMIEKAGTSVIGHNAGPPLDDDELTGQQKDLALSLTLLKFVDDSANKYGGKRHGLIDDLVTIGRKTLESCAKSYDPQRGQFENYVRAAVKKAMLKNLREHRVLFVARIKNDKAVKRRRSSTGGYIEKSYIATSSKPRQSRLIADALDEHLVTAALNRNEQIALRHVFKSGDNPRSIRLLARKLDLTERRTRDVVKNAKAKHDQAVIAKNFRPK